jgi:hypothetical protein
MKMKWLEINLKNPMDKKALIKMQIKENQVSRFHSVKKISCHRILTLLIVSSQLILAYLIIFFVDYSKYTYESYWLAGFVAAIILFFKGRSANDTLAQNWKKACSEAISSNFAHFGTTKEPSLALE